MALMMQASLNFQAKEKPNRRLITIQKKEEPMTAV
jgi:hypothetical protein